nr:unnamed protein product [Callosobruchus chinensis]
MSRLMRKGNSSDISSKVVMIEERLEAGLEEIKNQLGTGHKNPELVQDSINDQEVTEDTSFEFDAAFDGILEKNHCELLQQEHQAKDGSGREVPQEHIEIIQLISNPMENENKGPISTVLVSKCTPSIDINSQQEHPAVKLRNVAYTNILQQAKKMTNLSNKKLGSFNVGDNVLLGISEFDRGRGDPANLIGIVLAEKGGKFKVGTKHGIVDTWLERNSLQSTKFKKLKLNDVPNYETNIRTLVRKGSVGFGQGYKRCNCSRMCNSKRCKCVKTNYLCNSACHAGRSCNNH